MKRGLIKTEEDLEKFKINLFLLEKRRLNEKVERKENSFYLQPPPMGARRSWVSEAHAVKKNKSVIVDVGTF